MTTVVTAVGLALALGGHRATSAVVGRVAGTDPVDVAARLRRSDLSKALAAGLLVGYVLAVENRSLASIGLSRVEPVPFVGLVAVGLALTLGASAVAQALAERTGFFGTVDETMTELGRLPAGQRLRVALVAGVAEELLFRGYLVERLVELLGNPVLAGVVSVVAFVAAHYGFWDAGESASIGAVALALVALYLWTRSLPVVVAVHVLHDATGLWMAGRGGGEERRDGVREAEDAAA